MSRTNGRFLVVIALSLLYLSVSRPVTSALHHEELNLLSRTLDSENIDHDEIHEIQKKKSLGGHKSQSSEEARAAVDDKRSSVGTSARVRSNQNGLISVSVVVEIEENKQNSIPLSAGMKDNRNEKKDRNGLAQIVSSLNQRGSSVASLENDTDILWIVSVEEIHMDSSVERKDDSKLTTKPYSQLVLLDWNKTKEVSEYVTETNRNTDMDNDTITSNRIYQEFVYYSGTGSCTFIIPIERDGSSLHPNSVSSPAYSPLTRTFIVSLMQSTHREAWIRRNSLYDDTRSNNYHNDRNTTFLLARRLVTLPRKTYSHYQSTVDPVANVFLHHSQRESNYEAAKLPRSMSSSDNDIYEREKGQPADEGEEESDFSSRNDLLDLFHSETHFLWTLLLLSAVHAIQSISVGRILMWVFNLRVMKVSSYTMLSIDSQEYDVDGCQQSTYFNDDEEGEDDPCNRRNESRFNQHFEETEERWKPGLPNQHSPLDPSHSEKSGKTISVDPQRKDPNEDFVSHNGDHIAFRYDDDSRGNKEKEGRKNGEPNNNNPDSDLIFENHRIEDKEAPLEQDIAVVQPSTDHTCANSYIESFSSIFPKNPKPKYENVKTSSNFSQKVSIQPIVGYQKSNIKNLTGSSSRHKSMPLASKILNSSNEVRLINNDNHEISIETTEPVKYLDPPLRYSPVGSSCILNSTNEKGNSSPLSAKEDISTGVRRFDIRGYKEGLADSRRSLSIETLTESRCNDESASEDVPAEVMQEYSDNKVKMVLPQQHSAEQIRMADTNVTSVTSTGAAYNVCTGSFQQDDIVVDALLPRQSPSTNSHTVGTGFIKQSSVTLTEDIEVGRNQEIQGKCFEKRHNGSSGRPSQLKKSATDFHEIGTKGKIQIGYDSDMAWNSVIRTNQDQHIACQYSREGLFERSQDSATENNFRSKFDILSASLPGQGDLTRFSNSEEQKLHRGNFGEPDQDLPKNPEVGSFSGLIIASTEGQTSKTSNSVEGNSKQIQSVLERQKSVMQEKHEGRKLNLHWTRDRSQGSETEESYVSTLPPDSDYVSEDDPSLLLLGYSSSKAQTLETQTVGRMSENERKQRKSSLSAQFRKRRRISRDNALSNEGDRGSTLNMIDSERLLNKSQKETNDDSVEVVRVLIPELEKRGTRPYSKSNYVADWVPSNELQSMSHEFLHEESWDLVAPTLRTSDTRVPKSIFVQSKKNSCSSAQNVSKRSSYYSK